jgi:hypothetical protein
LLSENINAKIYENITLPVVLNGCKTWSITLRAKHRLRVFDNRVLRMRVGAGTDDVTGERTELHSVAPHDLKSRVMRWAVHLACVWAVKRLTHGSDGTI